MRLQAARTGLIEPSPSSRARGRRPAAGCSQSSSAGYVGICLGRITGREPGRSYLAGAG